MKVLVIDGQGGGMGKQLVSQIKTTIPGVEVVAVGTNSLATQAMLKAGADAVATGENALIVNCRKADVIIGPVGIVIADALLGEISPAMATAVAQSNAKRILIPTNLCDNYIAGIHESTVSELIADGIRKLQSFL
ncbi:MAG: DUF3842 family protein [Erysipelotrichaceae bacterium]|nr:DUF3842 family protein [Erysipelotrichaceae bacterium]